jgi:hypothetical protein
MQPPALVSRVALLGASGRRVLAGQLHRASGWFDERCGILERFTEGVFASYADLWRRGWRWWAPSLLLAPAVCAALLALAALLVVGRLLGLTAAAAILFGLVAVSAVPVLGVAWALTSFVAEDSGTRPAAASRQACDPSYPDWCSTEEVDVDCPLGAGNPPYAAESNFVVFGRDVHKLDGDHDGIGCEWASSATP